ncbi:hypothetical protein SK128_013389 [Halocaridina rubra]|uniref:C2H2-type domain-containing protein n=1 Tax=Halocaridina rubra TaxID=373956 RepID=A0AAN8XM24_HALRR
MGSSEKENTTESTLHDKEVTLENNMENPEEIKEELTSVSGKVCEYCGRTFTKTPAYLQHLISHNPVQQCPWCTFKSKDAKRFSNHTKTHMEVQCNVCFRIFATPRTKRVHKKRIHKLYECKTCLHDFKSEPEYTEHVENDHDGKEKNMSTEEKIKLYNEQTQKEKKSRIDVEIKKESIDMEPDTCQKHESSGNGLESSQIHGQSITCHLCNKETMNKYDLRIHIAQHLGVSSDKLTDEDLFIEEVKPFLWSGGSASNLSFSQDTKYNILGSDNPMQSMFNDLSNKSSCASSNLTSPLSMTLVSRSSVSIDSEPPIIESELNIKEEPTDTDLSKLDAFDNDSSLSGRRKTRVRFVRSIPCDECDAIFKSYGKLTEHIRQKHRVRPACPLCKTKRTNNKKVFQHQKSSHKDKFRCHFLCLALFDTKEEQTTHHLEVHNKDTSKLTCRYCKGLFPRHKFMKHLTICENEHVRQDSPIHTQVCQFCELTFPTLKEYSSHIKYCGPWNKKNQTQRTDTEQEAEKSMVLRERMPSYDFMNDSKIGDSDENSTDIEHFENVVETVKTESVSDLSNEMPSISKFLEKGKAKHKCKHCPLKFEHEEDGIQHILLHHKQSSPTTTKEPLMCHVCGKTFLSSLAFCKHILNHYIELEMWDSLIPPDIDMESVRNTCWICKTSGMTSNKHHVLNRDKTIENILATKLTNPDGEPFYCSLCKESFPERHSFWKHIKIHILKPIFKNAEGGKRLTCSKCPLKFKKKMELYQHCATHLFSSDREYTDIDSDSSELESLSDKRIIAQRRRRRREKRMLSKSNDNSPQNKNLQKCKRCRKKFCNKEDAYNHVLKFHKAVIDDMVTKIQVCDICTKTFQKPMILCRHLLNHYRELSMWEKMIPRDVFKITTDRRFCWICNNTLGRKAYRHLNMRNAIIEKILSDNVNKMYGEESFLCTVCGAKSPDRYAYFTHIKLHYQYHKKKNKLITPQDPQHTENVEKFECNECLLEFRDKTDLNKHMAIHFLLPYIQETERDDDSIVKVKQEEDCKKGTASKEDDNEAKGFDKAKEGVEATSSQESKYLLSCSLCSKKFLKNEAILNHITSTHREFLIVSAAQVEFCHICGFKFKSSWCLCKHLLQHYNKQGELDAIVPSNLLETCKYRNYCWICKNKLGRHQKRQALKRNVKIESILSIKSSEDKTKKFKCIMCDILFPNRLKYWQHIQSHISKLPIKYTGKGHISTSSNYVAGKDTLQLGCLECPESFSDKNQLITHRATHCIELVVPENDQEEQQKHENEQEKDFTVVVPGIDRLLDGSASEEEWEPTVISAEHKVLDGDDDDKDSQHDVVKVTIDSEDKDTNGQNIECTRCSKVFLRHDNAVNHVISAHRAFLAIKSVKSEPCHVCGSMIKGSWCLCKHVMKHYRARGMLDALVPRDLLVNFDYRNSCWICKCSLGSRCNRHITKRNFEIKKVLKTEYLNENTTDFECSLCDLIFPNRLEYWDHIKIHIRKPIHSNTKSSAVVLSGAGAIHASPYECSLCVKDFYDEDVWYKHLASHYIKPVSSETESFVIKRREVTKDDTTDDSSTREDDRVQFTDDEGDIKCKYSFSSNSSNKATQEKMYMPRMKITNEDDTEDFQEEDEMTDNSENSENIKDLGKDWKGPEKDVSSCGSKTVQKSKFVIGSEVLLNCTQCSKVFSKTDDAIHHILNVHKKVLVAKTGSNFICHVCGAAFIKSGSLCRHICNHYGTLENWNALVPKDLLKQFDYTKFCWICKFQLEKLGTMYQNHCTSRTVTIEKLLRTKCSEDNGEDFQCSLCNVSFPNRLQYWMHIKVHVCKEPEKLHRKSPEKISEFTKSDIATLNCTYCSDKFVNEDDLYKHLAGHFVTSTLQRDVESEVMEKEGREDTDKSKFELMTKLNVTKKRIQEEVEDSDSPLSIEEWIPSNNLGKQNIVAGDNFQDVEKQGEILVDDDDIEEIDDNDDVDDGDDDDDMNEEVEDEELLGDDIEEEEDADDELEESGDEIEVDSTEEEPTYPFFSTFRAEFSEFNP